MLKHLFLWLDTHPAAYWAIALATSATFGIWLVGALRREQHGRAWRREAGWFGLLALAVLLAWRWPVLLRAASLNPDEGQLLAAALTYAHDPMPFRSVDLTTSGPLNGLVLLPTHWLGVPQDYFNARLVAALLQWGTLLAFFAALRGLAPTAQAATVLLPGLAFYATAADHDFVAYSSELPSVLLASWALACLWRAQAAPDPARRWRAWAWWLGGLCLGLMPWAKLQSAPLAAAIGLWAVFAARGAPRRIATLALAALLPSAVVATLVAAGGQFDQLVNCYLRANIGYMDTGVSWGATLLEQVRSTRFTWQLPAFFLPGAACVLLHLFRSWRRRRMPGPLHWAAAATSLAALYAVVAPRHAFAHYLLLLLAPFTLWVATALLDLWNELGGPALRRRLPLGIALFAVVPLLVARGRQGPPENYGRLADDWRTPHEDVARHVRRIARPDDRLAIWGWWTHLYVETGLRQGTREAHSERQLGTAPMKDSFYRPRYLADLRRNRPEFFVDAVGPTAFGYTHRANDGHETFPALRDLVAGDYTLLKDFGRARLYLRSDLVASRLSHLPQVVPLTIEGFSVAQATGAVGRLGDTPPPRPPVEFVGDERVFADLTPHPALGIFAHAPSRLVQPLPPGTLRVRGAGAFLPKAYSVAGNNTDGAVFAVRWLAVDGTVTAAWERRLDPRANPADRTPAEFDLPAPAGAVAVEFTIAPGPTASCDWTYWHDLRLDVPFRP